MKLLNSFEFAKFVSHKTEYWESFIQGKIEQKIRTKTEYWYSSVLQNCLTQNYLVWTQFIMSPVLGECQYVFDILKHNFEFIIHLGKIYKIRLIFIK